MSIDTRLRPLIKKCLSWLLVLALVFGVFAQLGVSFRVGAFKASDYVDDNGTVIPYTATVRVDESVGLRATVDVTASGGAILAEGITALETGLVRPNASGDITNEDSFDINLIATNHYAVRKVFVAAFAQFERKDGTMIAVKDVDVLYDNASGSATNYTGSYNIPDFTDYIENDDSGIEVECIVYADLAYAVNTNSTINVDLTDASARIVASGIVVNGTEVLTIDSALTQGEVIQLNGGNGTSGIRQIVIKNSEAESNAATWRTKREVHLRMNGLNFQETAQHTTYVMTQTIGQKREARATTSVQTYGIVSISNTDVFLTLDGASNTLYKANQTGNNGQPNSSPFMLDATGSLIITDASGSNALNLRATGCSAAIGNSGANRAAGYVEIDGGFITATATHNNHTFAGIGNGGHLGDSGANAVGDPGIRGIVINGGRVDAVGFHYGIGGNGGSGGSSSTVSSAVGEQYITITNGIVNAQASSNSGGAAIGFAYNNADHKVNIGRPDDTNPNVKSVNWGYGAAISGDMTFYSGETKAYSGQYAAAIGGNAVSNAIVGYLNASSAKSSSGSQVGGTPLTVYGGKITAMSGAFAQGGNSTELDPTGGHNFDNIENETKPDESYGAAIGGAIGQNGGDKNRIFAGDFTVVSSVFGAGIGGGGGFSGVGDNATSGTPGQGGTGGVTYIGNLYQNGSATPANMNFKISARTGVAAGTQQYGAGIGGGGTIESGKNGGVGGDVYIGGGTFGVFNTGLIKSDYGAGFGGGGSETGAGGAGGNIVISGGNFTVAAGEHGAGIGGGGSHTGAGGDAAGDIEISGGNFTVTAGTHGAGIGGGGTAGSARGGDAGVSGAGNKISISGEASDQYTITPGKYGAGIGGGGSASGAGGSVYADLTISGKGVFNILNNATDDSYGAGIGGGGSGTSSPGGNGPEKILVEGGSFTIKPGNHGAGIGGGGSEGGAGGAGGDELEITGGAFTIQKPTATSPDTDSYGAGIGGGGSGTNGKGGDGPTKLLINTSPSVATDKFTINASTYGAGIGGGGSATGDGGLGSDDTTITFGRFDITAGSHGAGIGGGGSGGTGLGGNAGSTAANKLTIADGEFAVYSGLYGAGIGGGGSTNGPGGAGAISLDILDGEFTVEASRGNRTDGYGAGIGGGGSSAAAGGAGPKTLQIQDGEFTVTGSKHGAGIGGGGSAAEAGGAGVNALTIDDGRFTVNGIGYGAGIGGGGGGTGGAGGSSGATVAIKGGNFTVNMGTFGAGIGGGGSQNPGTGGTAIGGKGATKLDITGGAFTIQPNANPAVTGPYYGAGIGGGGATGGNGGNGAETVLIDGGNFKIYNTNHGAGIGGGGSMTGNGGNGGRATDVKKGDFYIYTKETGAGIGGGGSAGNGNGGAATENFKVHFINSRDIAFTVSSSLSSSIDTFGAGIGGGGSNGSGNGGLGIKNFLAEGGVFNSISIGYGAGIGGGGTRSGIAGEGGVSRYEGGTVTATSTKGADMGGGSSKTTRDLAYADPAQPVLSMDTDSRRDKGEVTIIGGNIYTIIESVVPHVSGDPALHAWTQPFENGSVSGANGRSNATERAVTMENIPAGLRDRQVKLVTYNYKLAPGVNGNPATVTTISNYGVDDMYVTHNTVKNIGELWIWVPADFDLLYDLDGGYDQRDPKHGDHHASGFPIKDANRHGVGKVTATVFTTNDVTSPTAPTDDYNYPGDLIDTLKYNDIIAANAKYPDRETAATWEKYAAASNSNYVANGKSTVFFKLVGHDPVLENGVPVDIAFVGWARSSQAAQYAQGIFVEENSSLADFDYVDSVRIIDNDITLYAIWGFDRNKNGVADYYDTGSLLRYNSSRNAVSSAVLNMPANSAGHLMNEVEQIATVEPSTAGYHFIGWTLNPAYANQAVGANDALPNDIYVSAGNTNDFSHTTVQNIYHDITFALNDIDMYAIWGEDTDGDGIPDVLQEKYLLKHNPNPPAGYQVASTPPDNQYVTGQHGESYTVIGPADPHMTISATGSNTDQYVFIGWTANANVLGRTYKAGDKAILPADYANPLKLANPFSSSYNEQIVYAVWGLDQNTNGIADVLEDEGLHFVYDPNTTDPVDGVPVDPNGYKTGDYVSPSVNNPLIGNTAGADPYMKREGFVFLGWTNDKTKAVETEYDLPSSAPYVVTAIAALDPDYQFDTEDIKLYAIWGIDRNGTGVPDGEDQYHSEWKIHYNTGFGDGLGFNVQNMPFANNNNYDDGTNRYPGKAATGFAEDEYAPVSDVIPTATDADGNSWAFIGWAPINNQETTFDKADFTTKTSFYRLLALYEDILSKEFNSSGGYVGPGNNYSGYNSVLDASANQLPIGDQDEAKYRLKSGLKSVYDNYDPTIELADYSVMSRAYSTAMHWYNDYNGQGLVTNVCFEGIAMDYLSVKEDIWQLYGVWGIDMNNNGAPDIFEDSYTLYYDLNGGTVSATGKDPDACRAVPNNLPGDSKMLEYKPNRTPNRVDSSFTDYIFLGWTLDQNQRDTYTLGDRNILPELIGTVTFGNYDITVHAVWSTDDNNNGIPDVFEDGFTVKYDANGGTGEPVDNTVYEYHSTATVDTATTPTHPSGYVFMYWTDDPTVAGHYTGNDDKDLLPGQMDEITFGPGGKQDNVTLYAVWGEDLDGNGIADILEKDYFLFYDANGGSGAPFDPNVYQYMDEVTLDIGANTVNGDYLLVGWTTEDPSAFSSVYIVGQEDMLPDLVKRIQFTKSNITVYAVWSTDRNQNNIPDVYEEPGLIIYNDNDGSENPNEEVTGPFAPGETIIVPEGPVREGHTFIEWNTEPDGSGISYKPGDSFVVDGNTTLYGQWDDTEGPSPTPTPGPGEGDKETITFNPGDGGEGEPIEIETDEEGNIIIPDQGNMQNGDKIFVGWATNPDGSGTIYYPGQVIKPEGDLSLHAVWKDKADGFSGYFNPNFGDHEAFVKEDTDGKLTIIEWDETGIPTREGYTFMGWNTTSDGSGTSYKPGDVINMNGNLYLFAIWEEIGEPTPTPRPELITVTYDPNGGTGGLSVQVEAGKSHALYTQTAAKVVRDGYEFKGWTAAKDGTGTVYEAGQTRTITANTTFYAKWEAVSDLNKDDHIPYISGYPDKTVRAEGQVTRAEVASMFYKLLNANTHPNKEELVTSPFNDVTDQGAWYYRQVTYLAKVGILSGYNDGSFKPNAPITRAEFAALSAKFDDLSFKGENHFTDVSKDFWAYEEINSAYEKGWVSGYPDGTYKPTAFIKRVEACSMINKVLERQIDDAAKERVNNPFTDLAKTYWGYGHIMEAATDHKFTRDDQRVEHWTAGSYAAK